MQICHCRDSQKTVVFLELKNNTANICRRMSATEITDIDLQDGSCTFSAKVIGTQLLFSLPDSAPQMNADTTIVLDNGVQYIPLYVQEALPNEVVGSYVVNQQLPLLNHGQQIILTDDQIMTLDDVNDSDIHSNVMPRQLLKLQLNKASQNDVDSSSGENRATIIPENEEALVAKTVQARIVETDVVDSRDKTVRATRCPEECDTCGLRFESRKLFKKHVLSHLHEKPFECPHCPETFNHEYNYIPHVATHNEMDPYCPVCNKRFSRLAGLKAHIKIHQCDDTIPCPECLEEFSTQGLLDAHRLEHKSDFVKLPTRLHSCHKCDEKFTTKMYLEEHVQDVHKIKMPKKVKKGKGGYVCEFCKKRLEKPSQLVRHRRIHTGEKPFQCAECGKGFGQKGSLHIHFLKHSGEKPYACQYCSSQFSQKGNLQAHIIRIHPEESARSLSCTFCACVFKNIVSLHSHLSRFHGVDPKALANDLIHKTDTPAADGEAEDRHSIKTTSNKENEVETETVSNGDERAKSEVITMNEEVASKQKPSITDVINKCKYCAKIFEKRADLVKHLKLHANEKRPVERFRYLCKCGRQFPKRMLLLRHLKTAHPEPSKVTTERTIPKETHKCGKCDRSFDVLADRTAHEEMEHPVIKLDPPSDQTTSTITISSAFSLPRSAIPMKCAKLLISADGTIEVIHDNNDLESTTASSQRAIEQTQLVAEVQEVIEEPTRREIVDEIRKYKCEHCNLAFKQQSHWKTHLRIHTGEKPFQCTICDKAFASKSALTTHQGIHDAVPAFNCHECGKAFSTSRSLKRHMELHVVGFSYSCTVCSRSYKTRVAWQKHITTHMKQQKTEVEKKIDVEVRTVGSSESDSVVNESDALRLKLTDVKRGFEGLWNDWAQTLTPDQQFNLHGEQNFTSIATTKTPSTSNRPSSTNQIPMDGLTDKSQLFDPLSDKAFDGCVFLQNSRDLQTGNQTVPTTVPSIVLPSARQANTHPCSMCNVSFDNLVELSIHKTTHLQDKWTICPTCDKSFNSQQEYQDHFRVCQHSEPHTDKVEESQSTDYMCMDFLSTSKLHRCAGCDIKFFQADDYTSHVLAQHGAYGCQSCSDWFKTTNLLEAHQRSHDQETERDDGSEMAIDYSNSLTQPSASEPKNADVRVNIGEPNEREPRDKLESRRRKAAWRRKAVRTLTEEEQLAIAKESPNSISEKVLQQSILGQNADKQDKEAQDCAYPNKCKYCPKSFRKPSDLVRHLRVHTGEKPYMCTSCNKSFSIKSSADSHVKIHKKERAYSCHICHNHFAAIGSLKVHMRLHTGAKPFACELCPAKFRTSGHRKSHMFSHMKKEAPKHRNKPFDPLPACDTFPSSPDKPEASPPVEYLPKPAEKTPSEPLDTLKKPLPNSQFLFSLDGPLGFGENPLSNQQYFLKEVKGNEQSGNAAHFVVTMGDEISYQDNITDLLESVPNLNVDHEDRFNLDLDVPKEQLIEESNCTVCGKVFATRLELDSHVKKDHFANSLLSCNVCKQNFRGKTDLEVHMLVHELDQLSCHACSLEFPDESALRKHKCTSDDSDIKTMPTTSLDLASVVHEFFSFPAL